MQSLRGVMMVDYQRENSKIFWKIISECQLDLLKSTKPSNIITLLLGAHPGVLLHCTASLRLLPQNTGSSHGWDTLTILSWVFPESPNSSFLCVTGHTSQGLLLVRDVTSQMSCNCQETAVVLECRCAQELPGQWKLSHELADVFSSLTSLWLVFKSTETS